MALGITFQAVSRWESELAYPDIELIPAIANYFGVTIDELFGFESNQEKTVADILAKVDANNYYSDGGEWLDKCILLLREGLAQFPDNEKLRIKLADMLWRAGLCHKKVYGYIDNEGYFRRNYEENSKNHYGAESIKICESLAENAKDKDIVYSANHLLIRLYRDIGETGKAIACAERLPPMYRCCEFALCAACDGKEHQYTAMFLKNIKYTVSEIPQGCHTEDLPNRFPVWDPVYSDINEIKADLRWVAWEKKCIG